MKDEYGNVVFPGSLSSSAMKKAVTIPTMQDYAGP